MIVNNMIKTRIAAIIIQNNKILLLKGRGYEELWTPGGKIEENETDEDCLRRELHEEINVKLKGFKFFKSYTAKSPYHDWNTHQRAYIASIEGEIQPRAEIEDYVWYTKDDLINKKYPMIPINEVIINDLIEQGIF